MNHRPLRTLAYVVAVALGSAAAVGLASAQNATPQNAPADPSGDTGTDEGAGVTVRSLSPQQRLQGAEIQVHGVARTREESQLRVHGTGTGDPSAIEVHGSNTADPSRIRVRRFGGRDSARIKVHELGQARPSRIRVHR
jgi:hypothetical protein